MTLLRHNLPAEPNRFVGRDRDLTELCALIDEVRLLTLSGVGGTGKTRCALRIAARVVESFPDGVWIVELSRLTRSDLLVHEITTVLGVREEGVRPLLDTLLDFVRGRRLLLVLDNCEHLVEACAQLAETLLTCCPDLRILVTSREPLKIASELVWRVPPLALPGPGQAIEQAESVQLFLERARSAGSGLTVTTDNARDIARLCRDLDGLPLALELAAARTVAMSPGQISARVKDNFRVLNASARTAPARQRTLLATMQWSHDLLSAPEQVLFRRLAVFSGPFTLDLAESVCAGAALPRAQVLDVLTDLVDKSLVQFDQDSSCYRLLESVRQFAAELLESAGERERMRDQLLHGLADLAQRHGADVWISPDLPWATRYARVLVLRDLAGNAREALTWAVTTRQTAQALRLACGYFPLWYGFGEFAEGRHWYRTLVDLPGADAVPDLVAEAVVHYANLAFEQQDSAAAEEWVQRALALRDRLGSGFTASYLLVVAGMYVGTRGDLAKAAEYAEESLELATRIGSPWAEGLARLLQAGVAAFNGHKREVLTRGDEAVAAFVKFGHAWGVSKAHLELGRFADFLGDLDAARRHLEECANTAEELDTGPILATSLGLLALVLARQGESEPARERVTRCVALSRSMGQHLPVVTALAALAVLAEDHDDLEPAVQLWAAAKALEESTGLPVWSSASPEPLLARARALVGEGKVSLWWSLGSGMTAEEAVQYGLDGVRPAHSAPKPPSGPGAILTPREREIVALISRGLSNRAIGEELFISPATAARHVANILLKLNFGSRAQVAAWAAEHNITQ
ncbi:tetratricopeptide repeat protein [Nonomuraea sp. NN258]|uniref:LuxR C-terminal-related transcriptional regulator n=1 Tax=Nonomuraea antri TaxID=2730852 RepID=UPI0015693D06|nr:LuxR C-terminal-related transcriptional regulator [Nonomuraea antri]NRQ36368.1 tetratricopeptide repeat protein [Nonomuraea antri]